ncbi:MAG: hypothetical protein Q9221_005634 [Calogaya cf. arnoldii]
MWVSRMKLDAGLNQVAQLVVEAIRNLGDNNIYNAYSGADNSTVDAEWVGHRAGVSSRKEPEPRLSEQKKFEALTAEASDAPVILYVFGGNFNLGTPAQYRGTASRLARLTQGRVLMVSYRLAPRCPFPAALIDILVAYLSLLYPSKESYHTAIPAKGIVLARDSAGAYLCLSVIKTILSARQTQQTEFPTVIFNSQPTSLLMPAGLVLLSPSLDQTMTLPSFKTNASTDILQDFNPAYDPDYPVCELWPSNPRRANLYCDADMLAHPLVSPVTARSWADVHPCGLQSEEASV